MESRVPAPSQASLGISEVSKEMDEAHPQSKLWVIMCEIKEICDLRKQVYNRLLQCFAHQVTESTLDIICLSE